MGIISDGIKNELAAWLERQPVFFVATASSSPDGHVNCSPKGNRGEFAVLGPTSVAYLDQTGSGIETVAHLRENGRITLMFCAFSGPPRIVRLQGAGKVVTPDTAEFAHLTERFDAPMVGARTVIVAELERVSDSCGFGVPLMSFSGHRPALDAWARKKGPEGLSDYRRAHNMKSIDGLDALAESELS